MRPEKPGPDWQCGGWKENCVEKAGDCGHADYRKGPGLLKMESALAFEEISKSYYGVPVLRHVSFALRNGTVLGLVGENGAGKTTLMNILGGILPPESGRMWLCGEPYAPASPAEAALQGIAFIHQELNLFGNLTIAQNFFITCFPQARIFGVRVNDLRSAGERARLLLDTVRLSVPPNTIVEQLSPGERQLVEIAKALSIDARIMILDEPTTSLTARETAALFDLIQHLRLQKKSMIYISHNLSDVQRLCDDIAILRDGQVVAAGARVDFTTDRMVSAMVGRSIGQLYPARWPISYGRILLDVRELASPGVLEGISFMLRAGEILGIYGLMGSGRTELARVLFGLDQAGAGEVVLDGESISAASPRSRIRRGLAFLPENRRDEGLMMEASVRDNISLASLPAFARRPLGLIDRPLLRKQVRACAERLRIRGTALDRQSARTLSGGNQQKAVLAKWLLTDPLVMILDEPTRGVDVGARCEIYEIINGMAVQGKGILLISSEIEELMGMCDRILVMRKGGLAAAFNRDRFDREGILRQALGGTTH